MTIPEWAFLPKASLKPLFWQIYGGDFAKCMFFLKKRILRLLQPDFLLCVDGLAAVACVGDRAYDKESGERVEAEHLGADEDGGEQRVRRAAEDRRVSEGCCEWEGNSHDGCDDRAEGGADGEQRGDLAALEPDRERDDGEEQL